MRIGILNSGGDCPGLNAVLHAVVGTTTQFGGVTVGFYDGFEGLLEGGRFVELSPRDTNGILKIGGTILGTTNMRDFKNRLSTENLENSKKELITKICNRVNELNLDALIVVGGNRSLTVALQLYQAGLPVIGVPKTIDNDLQATAMTFGFDSAVSCVVDALDRLRVTASSHKRIMVVEVMGRNAGWIALWGGIAGGADVILIPEVPFSFEVIQRYIEKRESESKNSTMIVVAEGAQLPEKYSEFPENSSQSIGKTIAKELEFLTGKDTRSCTLGHLQRGGAPTSLDRILGARFGVKAAKMARNKEFGQMVSYQSYQVSSVSIEKAVHQMKSVNPQGEMMQTARAVGICMGDILP